MHGLTTAEYQTVRAILDLPRSAERERIAASGIPSSTYTAARRRVFEEGWLSDIIVPNPGPWGLAGVDVRLARPSIADRSALRAKWEADPECVLLWEGIHSVLGVFFRRATESSGPPNEPPGPAEWKDAFLVSPRRTEGGIPVFFDYSGLWDRFGGSGPSPSYPAGLDLSAPVASRRLIAAAIELVEEHGGPAPGTAHRLPILRSSPRHLEAMENRVVELRTILDPAKVPPFGGHRLGEVILVQG
ncbi:MAG TPA: hypothetical protein VMH90_01850, partial [Thermoplasmata archaeon]|nr:hypothetical protein [Thermoplasmata archaeon]